MQRSGSFFVVLTDERLQVVEAAAQRPVIEGNVAADKPDDPVPQLER